MDLKLEDDMCEEARQLNERHLRLVDPAKCPYLKEGCNL
jgi:hypothetical protein